jgi:PAS domain S-box-containing protein
METRHTEGAEERLRRLAAELEQTRAELLRERGIFTRGPVVVFRWRAAPGWPVEHVSANIAQLGYTPLDFLSGRIPYASVVHPEDLPRVAEEVRAHTEAGAATFVQAYRLRSAEGEYRWFDDWTVVVRDEAGAVTHYDGYVLDVTERKRLEAELFQASKLESVGRLAGGVAHDFNNLLTVALLALDHAGLLARGQAELLGVLGEVRDVLQRATAFTRQLLAVARRQVAAPRVLLLDEAVREHVPLLGRLLGPSRELELQLAGAGAILADPAQLEQVLLNLVANARDATPDGGRVTIGCRRAEEAGARWARLSVTDTGTGIDAAVRERMFEPFVTTKPPGLGTGLGLATCYGIVRQCGGHIRAFPGPDGRGTTFEVDFPASPEAPSAEAPSSGPPAASPDAPPPAGTTVLVVDDEPDVRRPLVAALRAAGCVALEAGGLAEALEVAARAARLDLLLTDVVMPHGSGTDLADRLLAARPGLRVLFMSGQAQGRITLDEARVGFLEKPFDTPTLLRAVGGAVRAPS